MGSGLTHDVVIVGGGAAGLSAAVALARSLRSVVVIDAGEPRNAPADGMHNVLGHEGVSPTELLVQGRKDAQGYGAEIRPGRAIAARRTDEGFEVEIEEGGSVSGRRLLLATGLRDELPDVPGVDELWGQSVLHCAYCHGWEVRGKRICVLGTAPQSVHQALLFRQLSDDVTFVLHNTRALETNARERLEARDVRIVDAAAARLLSERGELRAVELDDGQELEADAVVVAPRFVARGDLYEQLGGGLSDHPAGRFIETAEMGRTEIPGVWAAGNAGDLGAMVSAAMGQGVAAAAAMNADLAAEDADAAVRARAASRF